MPEHSESQELSAKETKVPVREMTKRLAKEKRELAAQQTDCCSAQEFAACQRDCCWALLREDSQRDCSPVRKAWDSANRAALAETSAAESLAGVVAENPGAARHNLREVVAPVAA